MTSISPPPRAVWLAVAMATLAGCDGTQDGPSAGMLEPSSAEAGVVDNLLPQTQGFRKAVTPAGILEHLTAFQQFADANGGFRALGSPGYQASVQYVSNRMVAAGYTTTLQTFSFEFTGDRTPPTLAQVSPLSVTYVNGTDFASMEYSGSGDVTAGVYAVDFVVPVSAAGSSTSGCQAADFAGFPAGSIALVQRGVCTFREKALNAQSAGAVGVIIANDGAPGRTGIVFGTLNAPQVTLPVVGVSFAAGEALRSSVSNGPTAVTVHLVVDAVVETRTGTNVIAESRLGDPSRVIVVGSVLNSDLRGPGISGSTGAAAALEIAETFAAQERNPVNRLRFIWFGGSRLLGPDYYLESLSTEGVDDIAAMVHLRALGSPNFGRFVFDGDNSTFSGGAAEGPPGSGAIEKLFNDYFARQSLGVEPLSLAEGTDHLGFTTRDIPVGGLYAGQEEVKSAAQQALFGGVSGQSFDPCFSQACDVLSNVSRLSLDQLSDAAAHAVLLLSRRNLNKSPLATP